jgi:hypothetical protein
VNRLLLLTAVFVFGGCQPQPDAPWPTDVPEAPLAATAERTSVDQQWSELRFSVIESRLARLEEKATEPPDGVSPVPPAAKPAPASASSTPHPPGETPGAGLCDCKGGVCNVSPPGVKPKVDVAIVFYTQAGCGPYKEMEPVLDRLRAEGCRVLPVLDGKPVGWKVYDDWKPDKVEKFPRIELYIGGTFKIQWNEKVSYDTIRDAIDKDTAKPVIQTPIPKELGPVMDSTWDPGLQLAAAYSARLQAAALRQGHHQWDQRRAELLRMTGANDVAEICAESWPEQADAGSEALWTEMFRCWRQSPGHWSVAGRKHRLYGAGMERGENGVWYAALLAAD